MNIDEVKTKLSRQAIGFNLLDPDPQSDIKGSYFGQVLVAKKDEKWPEFNGKPMIPLCQINLTDLPYKPENLKNIEFITIFINSEYLPTENEQNGESWCLRTYEKADELIPLEQLKTGSPIIVQQLLPYLIEKDYPIWDDVSKVLDLDDVEDALDGMDYYDVPDFVNHNGIKIGGWPTLIQSEIEKESGDLSYVFQIDSFEELKWSWGDSGVGYFLKRNNPDEWEFDWQCM